MVALHVLVFCIVSSYVFDGITDNRPISDIIIPEFIAVIGKPVMLDICFCVESSLVSYAVVNISTFAMMSFCNYIKKPLVGGGVYMPLC